MSHINLAACLSSTQALGPGNRFALWVQGCCFNCPECIAPAWIPQTTNQLISVNALAKRIIAIADLEGITLSGGEPMLQAAELSALIDEIHIKQPKLTVICYTGFRLEQLQKEADCSRLDLLARIDVLIDGTYQQQQNNGLGLRGSDNQQIHFLTDIYKGQEAYFTETQRRIELHILEQNEVMMAGIPSKHLPEHLQSVFQPGL